MRSMKDVNKEVYSNYKWLKAPIYFKQDRRTNWCDIISNKMIGRNEVCLEFVSAVKNIWPKQTFWGSSFWLLCATIGPWQLLKRWVCSRDPPSLMWDFYFFPSSLLIQRRSNAGEQHLQVTSNINTPCRIAELPHISAPVRSFAKKRKE